MKPQPFALKKIYLLVILFLSLYIPVNINAQNRPVQDRINTYVNIPIIATENEGSVQSVPGVTEISDAERIQIAPNPFKLLATLTVNPKIKLHDAELSVYELTGKKIKNVSDINDNSIVIDRTGLSSGVYFFTLVDNENFLVSGKMIID